MKYEYCCKCGDKTGKAGAGDDSLYTEHDGPFCEDCFPDAKPKQEQGEPVAYGMRDTMIGNGNRMMYVRLDKGQDGCTVPLYEHAQQRKPLTDEQIDKAWRSVDYTVPWEQYRIDIARAIEAAHGIKE